VGRGAAWRDLEAVLADGRSGLVLIHGAPGVGRTHLMKAFGAAAREDRGYRVMGCDIPIPIEVTTQLRDIHRVVTSQLDGSPEPEPAGPVPGVSGRLSKVVKGARETWRLEGALLQTLRGTAPVMIAVDGYAPSPAMEDWLVTRLLPAIRDLAPPVVIVVVDRTESVETLRQSALLSLELGSLDESEVAAHLQESTTHLSPPLSPAEVTAYAAATAGDPALVRAFDRVFATVSAAGS
jgi:hypothetical protein